MMTRSRVRIARDYNRGLPFPIRLAHVGTAAVMTPLSPVINWLRDPARRAWAWPLALGVVGVLVFLPMDGLINRMFRGVRLGGDIKREAEFIQQYGQFMSTVIAMVIIMLADTDRARVRRLLDWIAAVVVGIGAINFLKMFIGRPRPKFDDPWGFIGPAGEYAIPGVGLRHSWEVWRDISSDLWSMPSSHTAYAVIASVALAAMYPRLRPLVIVLAVVVGVCRVVLNAHYPSDVIAGAAVGWIIGTGAMAGRWGQRVVDGKSRG